MERKSRSPRYPSISLQEAIDKIRLVYEKEHTHKTNREVIAKDLGYTGINGRSATLISTLKQFGLLEGISDSMRVTEDATIILELPSGDPERSEAIRRVAFTPKLFSEIYEEYGDKLPSDENLRLFLVKQGFNSNAADCAIRAFRETLSIVKSEIQGYNEESNTYEVRNNMSRAIPYIQQRNQTAELKPFLRGNPSANLQALGTSIPESNYTENLHYRISEDCKARILFEGVVTQEAIKKLIAYLELGIDDFPQKAKIEQIETEDRKPLPTNT